MPPDEALPRNWIAEQKPDGFRAILFVRPGSCSSPASARTSPAPSPTSPPQRFSEALVLDGELVVPHEGRLHFGELQRRARRRGRSAVPAAAERPAYLIFPVKFSVLKSRRALARAVGST
jgi:ATP-dependent DNA ligase